MKTCSDCSEAKDLTEFYTKGRSKTGVQYYEAYCKICSAIRSQQRAPKRVSTSEQRDRKLQRNREWHRATRDDPATRHVILWKEYRADDRKKGRSNDLSKERIKELISLPCQYCGDTEGNMTLDRIDNGDGHTENNVITSCLRCNIIKRDMPFAAWQEIAPVMRSLRERGLFGEWVPRNR